MNRSSLSPAWQEKWIIPYIDQPVSFWLDLYDEVGPLIKEVYVPLPWDGVGSGRPLQPDEHLDDFWHSSPFPVSVLINPLVLPRPVEEMAGPIINILSHLEDTFGLSGVTVADFNLAASIKKQLPHLALTASVLMDIAGPHQALMIAGICDNLVAASRVMRNLPALEDLRQAFPGRMRLLVNEACLPGCPLRTQHFYEMASGISYPSSLCAGLLERFPWLCLTGAWVLPQHLALYQHLDLDFKLAGRATLQDPKTYRRTLLAYIQRTPLSPDEIGGGPASVPFPIAIIEEFFRHTLECGRRCHECRCCRDYYYNHLHNLNEVRPGVDKAPATMLR